MSQYNILKINDVTQKVKLKKSSIYAKVKEKRFPAPIKLGERSTGWIESEIDHWLHERMSARES